MLSIPTTQVAKSKSEKTTVLGLNPKTDMPAEPINEQLKKHQVFADWDKQKLMQDLHLWIERFRFEFKLKIEEIPAIMIGKIGRSTYGHFRPGRNGFGLRN
ncbi:hypothetical protein KAR91_66465, partial [Candidatus Pacearchaeota archaeon]|nr:hypothetical protein [Candidatus Pacearchaeota archaeon]